MSVESEIHAKLDPGVEEVVRGKRIALWKEMLESIGYSDLGVVDEFCNGATLTGPTCPTGLWPKQFTPATLTEEELHHQAKFQRHHLTYDQVVFFGEEIALFVWQQTLDEVAKGELEGPLALEDIPLDVLLSKRFGVKKGGKVRCADDFSASGVNATAQPLESPKPHTLDVVVGMISTIMACNTSKEKWNIRSFDLKSAYWQCAEHPHPRKFAVIVVGDPSTRTLKAFRLKALPFGSVKSVHSFLRVVRSIWTVLTTIFLTITTNYFDDFISLATEAEAQSVDFTVKAVLGMLGWKFAEDGPKAPPFSSKVTALGVEIDVGRLHQGFTSIGNTEKRTTELSETIEGIVVVWPNERRCD